MKRITAFLLMFTMLFALTACRNDRAEEPEPSESPVPEETQSPDVPEMPEPEPFRIGHVADMGDAQAIKAVAFAAEYVGGLSGRSIELLERDTDDPVEAARELVEEEQAVCLISSASGVGQAELADYARSAGVPLLFYEPVSAQLLNDWTFAAGGTCEQMAAVMADYTYCELGYGQVYLLTAAGEEEYAECFQSSFDALGGWVIAQVEIPTAVSDLMPYLRAMNDPDAQAVVVQMPSTRGAEFWQTWFDLGLNGLMDVVSLTRDSLTGTAVLEKLDSAVADTAKGTASPASGPYIVSAENQDFAKAWEEEFGASFVETPNSSGAVQLLMLLDHAAARLEGQDISAEALRGALMTAEATGPDGHVAFRDGNVAAKDFYVIEVGDGYAPVTSKKYADVTLDG